MMDPYLSSQASPPPPPPPPPAPGSTPPPLSSQAPPPLSSQAPPPLSSQAPPPLSSQAPPPPVQRPTAWTTSFPDHQPPQPPPPHVAPAPAFAPSERTAGASTAKAVVLGIVGVFVVLPILAIFALTMLGRTVQSEFAEVPVNTGTAFEEVPAPVTFQGEVPVGTSFGGSDFSLTVPGTWDRPSVNQVDGTAVTTWRVPEFDAATVEAWSRTNDSNLSTEGIIQFEAARAGLIIDSYQTSVIEGEPAVVALYSADETVGALLVVHSTSGGYAAALASTDLNSFIFLIAEYQPNLRSIRYTG